MTVRQPLFQENDTTDQSAEIGRLMLRDVFTTRGGIITSTSFEVRQRSIGANNSVDVQPGGVVVTGTESAGQGFYHVSSSVTTNVAMNQPADPTNPRIDTIIVRVRDSAVSGALDEAAIEWISGTAAASPVAPDLDALGVENYYKLANVAIGVNDNTVTSTDITDLRTSPNTAVQSAATLVGGIIPCTSTTRPALPRHGQSIWEENTRQWLINDGTPAVPSWIVYGQAASQWTNFSPNFPLSGSFTTYGRYVKLGRLVFGITGFKLQSGTGNISSGNNVKCRLPTTAANPGAGPLVYLGGGRAFNSTGLFVGVYWSCSAEIVQGGTELINFATAGTGPWNATVPFNWGPPGDIYETTDHMHMLFCYESAT